MLIDGIRPGHPPETGSIWAEIMVARDGGMPIKKGVFLKFFKAAAQERKRLILTQAQLIFSPCGKGANQATAQPL
jgi:hypothetical protein